MPHTDAPTDPELEVAGGDPARDRANDPAGGPGPREQTTMLRAAVRPRMLVLLLVLLGAAAVCVRLGVWQLDRAEIRGESSAAQQLAAQEAQPPVGLGDVLAPQTAFTGGLVGRRVVVRGVYDAAGQVLVVDRALDGRTGYLVLTPLRVTDDRPRPAASSAATLDATPVVAAPEEVPAGTPVLPVVRGWVAVPDDAAALAVPTGEVTVTAWLQSSEASGRSDLPPGQVDAISSAQLLNRWGGPIWTGYGVLRASDPDQGDGLTLLPTPVRSGTGLNVQNLAYAAQWWIFGGFAIFLWLRMVRDEASGDRAV
ncbi:MAG: SURF1 family protein [Cellulomonas sp.]